MSIILTGFLVLAVALGMAVLGFLQDEPNIVLIGAGVLLTGPAIFLLASGFERLTAERRDAAPRSARTPRRARVHQNTESTPGTRVLASIGLAVLAGILLSAAIDNAAEEALAASLSSVIDVPNRTSGNVDPELLFGLSALAGMASTYQLVVAAVMRGILVIRENDRLSAH